MGEAERRPVLSISLLSSDRIYTIKRCLNSLRPIMEQVDSELIIVNTGHNDEVKNLLKDYTDQIVPFTWCNDFSMARNAGLEKARGEWFLYIDDDEWFTDVSEIVTFFHSGEYKQYGAACYIQRNYADMEGKRYEDCWVSRMIRLEKDVRFVSPIHEHLEPVRGEMKLLHSPADHYGYLFTSDQKKFEHARRNITLLESVLKQNPGDVRGWIQLANEYRSIGEMQKLEELCRAGLRQFKDSREYSEVKCRGTLYTGQIIAQLAWYDYRAAERTLRAAFTDKAAPPYTFAKLYSQGAEIYFYLGNLVECENCCRQYIALAKELEGIPQAMIHQSYFFVSEALESGVKSMTLGYYIICGLRKGDVTPLKEYFPRMNWQGEHIYLPEELTGEIISAMSTMDYDPVFAEIAATLIDKKGLDRVVMEQIDSRSSEGEGFRRLVHIFSQVPSEHPYIVYMKICAADLTGNLAELWEYYQKIFTHVTDIFQLEDVIFDIAEKHELKLEELFFQAPFAQWKKGVDALCEDAALDKVMERESLLVRHQKSENVRYDYFYMKVAEKCLKEEKGQDSYQELNQKIADFTEKTMKFMGRFFKDSAFAGEMEMLPEIGKLAVRLEHVLHMEKTGDLGRVKDALRLAMEIHPAYSRVVQEYAKLYAGHRKKQLEQQRIVDEEMQALGKQIKASIRTLLDHGMPEEAGETLEQLRSLLPGDEELAQLEEEIRRALK